MTDVFEGSLIRVFRRLQELIRQMSMGMFAHGLAFACLSPVERLTPFLSTAAKAIGSEELEKKFNDSLACLERPSSVAFAASLVSHILVCLPPLSRALNPYPFFSTFERPSAFLTGIPARHSGPCLNVYYVSLHSLEANIFAHIGQRTRVCTDLLSNHATTSCPRLLICGNPMRPENRSLIDRSSTRRIVLVYACPQLERRCWLATLACVALSVRAVFVTSQSGLAGQMPCPLQLLRDRLPRSSCPLTVLRADPSNTTDLISPGRSSSDSPCLTPPRPDAWNACDLLYLLTKWKISRAGATTAFVEKFPSVGLLCPPELAFFFGLFQWRERHWNLNPQSRRSIYPLERCACTQHSYCSGSGSPRRLSHSTYPRLCCSGVPRRNTSQLKSLLILVLSGKNRGRDATSPARIPGDFRCDGCACRPARKP